MSREDVTASSLTAALHQQILDVIPTNWLDSLLSGPNAVARKPCGCPDTERLLLALKVRLEEALAAVRAPEGHQPLRAQIEQAARANVAHGMLEPFLDALAEIFDRIPDGDATPSAEADRPSDAIKRGDAWTPGGTADNGRSDPTGSPSGNVSRAGAPEAEPQP